MFKGKLLGRRMYDKKVGIFITILIIVILINFIDEKQLNTMNEMRDKNV